MPAEKLWKGVTSVSNAGKKRGRGRAVGKKTAKNLNRGQVIGVGNALQKLLLQSINRLNAIFYSHHLFVK